MTKSQERDNPGSCFNRSGEDEPIFVLRARDPIAAATVNAWVKLAKEREIHKDRIEEALSHAQRMQDWRATHAHDRT